MEVTIIGRNIKALRKEAGLSSQELAILVRCTRRTIQRYENTGNVPDLENLIRIAQVLSVPLDQLVSPACEADPTFTIPEIQRYYRLYQALYRNEVRPGEPYYWIYLEPGGDQASEAGCQSEWVGFTEELPLRELRKARPYEGTDVSAAIQLCTRVHGPPLILNSVAEIGLFLLFGGQAIARASLCDQFLPEIVGVHEADPAYPGL